MIIRSHAVANTAHDVRVTIGNENAVSTFKEIFEFDRTNPDHVEYVIQEISEKFSDIPIDGFDSGNRDEDIKALIRNAR